MNDKTFFSIATFIEKSLFKFVNETNSFLSVKLVNDDKFEFHASDEALRLFEKFML